MNPTRTSERFGARLRKMREAAGLTQEVFARKASITQAHLSKLETGKRLPEWNTTRRLSKMLGTLPGKTPEAVAAELLFLP